MSPTTERCLQRLADLRETHGAERAFTFATIGDELPEFSRATIRRTVRLLARRGHAEYCRGLYTAEGDLAGSGYCITETGYKAARPDA